ncbi:sensor histidine kinase [Amycolatopsis rhabdoformis]|uniref:Sensor histidine kinase n=1 Tax=Amycolatopsis rhabdoformis TaxID=1448059 RepID=A0ABZ1I7A1_9PSEU|nr:sensor histidine kinase [Amycolatopsis rhabdoformis]WSE29841.1 sensor histidine kinase [Amycolatopsis rhabdoformis]
MDHNADRWVLGWRRFVLDAGMLVYPAVTVVGLVQAGGTTGVVGCLLVAVFCSCYVAAAIAADRRAVQVFGWLLAALGVLFLATLPFAHADAFFLAIVVVAFVVPRLDGRWAVLVVVLAGLAAVLVPWAVPAWHSGPGWTQAVALVFTTLMVYAFAEAIRANRELVQARAEVQRLAAEGERARISRDLHDLLGHSLTAITVKSQLARRLSAHDPARTLDEITEVERLSRQALADVRAAVSGSTEVTLAGELARGRELLRAAGVTADLPTAIDVVDGPHRELFGWVVREGLTNVARHARATRCTVRLSASEVEVRDDGVGAAATGGNGLAGLRSRVAEAGGRMEAGPVQPRGWRLCVAMDLGTPA